MKTVSTDEQIKAVTAALDKVWVRPFCNHFGNPKLDAQKNLSGKTFYVEDNTLRFHKSRVLSCVALHGGLLLRIVTSDAMDPDNRQRGYRAVVFDVFGTTVYRPQLDESKSTKAAALNACEKESIDLVEYYRSVFAAQIADFKGSIERCEAATSLLV